MLLFILLSFFNAGKKILLELRKKKGDYMNIQVNGNYGYTSYTYSKQIKGIGKSFADSLKTAATRENGKLTGDRGNPERVFRHIDEVFDAFLVNGIAHLSDEQRAMLNERFDMNNIRPGSSEYDALMNELKRLGVISDTMPLNLLSGSVNVDENGYIISRLTRVDDPQNDNPNILDWFKAMLNRRTEGLSFQHETGNFRNDALYEFLMEYKRSLSGALEELFKKDDQTGGRR
jgi:hypothetical protein